MITAIALVAATLLLGWPADTVRAATPPDIVVVMVDDLGYIEDERILDRLPNIASLFVANGLRLTQLYGETTWCCPGRVSFLTALHTHNHGVIDVTHPNDFDPTQTLATALHDVGYHTALAGKYINHPERLTDLTPPGWDRIDISIGRVNNNSSFYLDGSYSVLPGQWDVSIGQLAVDAVTAAPADQPLFLEYTPRSPHKSGGPSNPDWRTWVAPDKIADPRCANIAPFKPPSYVSSARFASPAPNGFPLTNICEAMLTVDDAVGAIRDAEIARGRPVTYLFMSDNGMAWGQHGWPQKEVPWATQIPVYLSGDGVSPGSSDALLSNIDLAPTLAELAGTSMPWADGHSFAALLSGGTAGEDWMLEDFPSDGDVGFGHWWGIRTPQWHLIVKPGHWTHLYNVVNDPWEQHNLTNRKKRAELRALYPWRATTTTVQ